MRGGLYEARRYRKCVYWSGSKRKEAIYKGTKTNKYKVFNIRCYEENIEYDDFYSMEDLSGYVTQKGDLIFRLSLPSKIILVDEKTEGLLINNLYCIIRCNDKKIKKMNF